ncbi:hypothetical protein ZOSMA_294G00230 [Zostera marina]|uniref:Uncharacterized protein n=1 Tax=Zostera marina TaxID=29655 RepID=A0A0K9PC74_ZOSMR|nr:hypothetical protein ZOSMA_294G00230 [Zostera marina]
MVDSNDIHRHSLQRKRPSWVSTVVVQVLLCVAFYVAITVWFPRARSRNTELFKRKNGISDIFVARSTDLYFLSVRGGSRPVHSQTQLLQQMEIVAKNIDVKFILDLSEVGENDPLLQNATQHYPSLNMLWYATGNGKNGNEGYLLKQFALSHGQSLDIIILDMESWKNAEHKEEGNLSYTSQMDWLKKSLAESDSNWRVILGYDPVIDCEEHLEERRRNLKAYHILRDVFLKHKVNVYLSKMGCAGRYFQYSGMAYIGNPSYHVETNTTREEEATNDDMFLLHRVNPLEIETYFIDSSGEVVSRHTLSQWGNSVL